MPTKNTTHKTNVKKTPAKKAPAKKAAPKAVKTEKVAQSTAPRHPKARVTALHGGKDGSKEALAKKLASSLAREDEDSGVIADRLKTASNRQLLRLNEAVETMKSKYGNRDKLVAAVAGTQSKDKDFTAKLEKLSLPNLLELAKSAERRARAQS
ncbi:MAG TPA: hypothetical protein VFQ65_04335 [Kofleriaceae bacterium]|nr:hypothetical protein [Kofleriaceae bacterium]